MTTPPAQTSPAGPDGALRRSKKQKTVGEYPGQGDVKGDAASTGSAVVLSQADRGAHTRVTDGGLGLSSSRGYRIVRATRGVRTGAWYYEVQVARLGATGAARIGWTTAGAELQGPVGADRFGFAYRSLEGSKVHAGMREPYGAAWGEGDVEVSFFKNGEFQGVAFADAPAAGAEYFPAVSLYTHATQPAPAQIRVNFGAQPFAIPGGVAAAAAAAGVPLCRPVRDVLLAVERPIKSDPGDGVAINLEASAL